MFDNKKASNHAKKQLEQHQYSRNKSRKDKRPPCFNTFEMPIGNRNSTEAVGNKQKRRDSQAAKTASSKARAAPKGSIKTVIDKTKSIV